MQQNLGQILYEVPVQGTQSAVDAVNPHFMYAAALPQSVSTSPVVQFRLQIQLQQRPPSPQQQSPATLQPQQAPQSQPKQPTPNSEPQQPTQAKSQAEQTQPPASISQIIQLLQLVQQLRTPVQVQQQQQQVPLPPQIYQQQVRANHMQRPVHHVYQQRFHPYNPYAPPSVIIPSRAPEPDMASHAHSSPAPRTEPAPRVTPSTPAAEPLSPPSSCPVDDESESRASTKRARDYTHEFRERFSKILQNSEQAQNEWREFRSNHTACTIARAPCIKVYREFCESFGGELRALSQEEKYEKLGSMTKCGCSPV